MTAARRPAAALLLAVLLAARGETHARCGAEFRYGPPGACAPESALRQNVASAARGAPDDADPAVRALAGDLSRLFARPAVAHAVWGAQVRSLARGDTLYALNEHTLLDPGSTTKIVTLAAAADRLGWNYRYETRLVTAAPVEQGVLRGDLVAHGTGDPTINAPGAGADLFEKWAAELRAAGIERIDGRIVGDDRALAGDVWTGLGPGWGWDDLGFGFATPSGALQHRENVVAIVVEPTAPGEPAVVRFDPVSGLRLINRVRTAGRATEPAWTLRRPPGRSALVLDGAIPAGAPAESRLVSVANPTDFFVAALRRTLIREGIPVTGAAVDVDSLPHAAPAAGAEAEARRVLAIHRSAPLSEIAVRMMKRSQNLYAESLLRTLGVESPSGSAADGVAAIGGVLESWGLDRRQFHVADGSGLSPRNALTAAALVIVLERLHGDPGRRTHFERTLPVAGRDGTLARRMRSSAAAGSARAKTGTKTDVGALAGYVDAAGGERLAFAILVNNFRTPAAEIVGVIDAAVERLAAFSRRQD